MYDGISKAIFDSSRVVVFERVVLRVRFAIHLYTNDIWLQLSLDYFFKSKLNNVFLNVMIMLKSTFRNTLFLPCNYSTM